MAPAITPGRKKRENNYFDVGVQGRKTGITLKDTGARDEHGMELLDGIFSSPEKSPPKRALRHGNAVQISSEEMQVAQSSAPEVEDVLSTRRLMRSSKTILPPPRGHSPIKTSLGSSPRRQSSVAPMSQARKSTGTPGRAASHPAVNRRLDFSVNEPRQSIEKTPLRAKASGTRANAETRADIFDIGPTPSPARGQKRTHDETIEKENPLENGTPEVQADKRYSSPLFPNGDDSMQMLHVEEDTGVGVEDQHDETVPDDETATPPRKPRRTRKSGDSVDLQAQTSRAANMQKKGGRVPNKRSSLGAAPDAPEPAPEPSIVDDVPNKSPAHKRRGRPPKKSLEAAIPEPPEPGIMEVEEEEEEEEPTALSTEESSVETGARKRKGRTAKNAKVNFHRDEEDRPSKRARGNPEPPAKGKTKKAKKPPPSERDPNARVTSTKKIAAKSSQEEQKRSGPRSLQILRQGTPMEDDGAHTTRFGRAVVKPVNWWMGERIDRDYDGTMKGIIRAESVEPPKRTQTGRKRGSRPKRDMGAIEETEEEDKEDWELDPGVITGFVRTWAPELGQGVDGEDDEQDIAFSATSMETRDVIGANFRYAKIITLPFFGSGLVDLPPGGYKLAKNSRKMQMVFFVHYGKVVVDVAGTEFTISKGGVWQVPRGNTYSINNDTKYPARIFFAQGCEYAPEVEE